MPPACRSPATTKASSKERIHLDKADRNTIYDDITVIDHALTRPFSLTRKAVRNPDRRPVWRTETCPADNSWIRIGETAYYVSADGNLIANQKRPGAARPEIFQAAGEVSAEGAEGGVHARAIAGRPICGCATCSLPRPLRRRSHWP